MLTENNTHIWPTGPPGSTRIALERDPRTSSPVQSLKWACLFQVGPPQKWISVLFL